MTRSLLLQIAAIVLAAIYSNEAESHTKEFFQHTIRKYYTTRDRKDAVTLSWDFMMGEVRYITDGTDADVKFIHRKSEFMLHAGPLDPRNFAPLPFLTQHYKFDC